MLLLLLLAMKKNMKERKKERLTFVVFLSHFLFNTDFFCLSLRYPCFLCICVCAVHAMFIVHMYHFIKWHRLHSMDLLGSSLSFILFHFVSIACYYIIFTFICDFKISSVFIQRFQFTFLYTHKCIFDSRNMYTLVYVMMW